MVKVIGIGGVFICCCDEVMIKKWYNEVLGLEINDYGVLFKFNFGCWKIGYFQLGIFFMIMDYFGGGLQQYMFNFWVDNLEEMVYYLKKMKVEIVDDIQMFDYGKFLYINDFDGNCLEFWEFIDVGFEGEVSVEMF